MTSDEPYRDQRPATLRPATRRDFAAVRALYALLQTMHAKNQPHVFAPAAGNELGEDDFRASLEAKDMLVLVAERDGEVVAAVQAGVVDQTGTAALRERRAVRVTHLITHPSARRQGHGRALMNAVAAWAHACEARTVELYVWDGNVEAAAFYRALGYRTMATLLALTTPEPTRAAAQPVPIRDSRSED